MASGFRPRRYSAGLRSLVPVANNLFRLDADPEPTRVFATDDAGTMVLTGGSLYAERKPRWRIESVRWPVLVSTGLVLTPLLMMIPWIVHARRAEPKGFWWLKLWLLLLQHRTPAAGDWP